MAEAPAPPTEAGQSASFAERVRAAIAQDVVPLVPDAERRRRFPRAAIERLGARGLFRERWSEGGAALGAVMAEELGRAGAGGVGLGVTVHAEAALSVLERYGRSPLLHEVAGRALRGEQLIAIAASEASGSDLAGVATELVPEGDGFRVRGHKRYVSIGGVADHLLVLARHGGSGTGEAAVRPTLVLVPRSGVQVEKRLRTAGVRSLATVRLSVDARVPREAVVGRQGAGALALSWGLTHERLATAAVTVGTAALAVGLATTHLHERRLDGDPLLNRQGPRFALAEHAAELAVLRRAVHGVAAAARDSAWMREVAGLKAVAARAAERIVSDCMHLLGGVGYLEDEAPLARLWRDVRAARIGGGTDEMMWELVAGGLVPDVDAYRNWVGTAS